MNCPHCDTPIDEHAATRCLDWWVETVCFPERIESNWHGQYANWDRMKYYGTDIAAAWDVMKKLAELGDVMLEWWRDDEWCLFTMPMVSSIWPRNSDGLGKRPGACAPTAPLAICRAAIKAVSE